MTGPHPRHPSWPYWEKYSREKDEELAAEFFYGRNTIINEKTGRLRHDYLPADGPDERRAINALMRLLIYSCGEDLDLKILVGLWNSIAPDGASERRLIFKRRKGIRYVSPFHMQIALH